MLLNLNRKNTYINCWETKDLYLSYFTVGQYMGGCMKTSTHFVTRKVQPSPYFRSKIGTALAASPTLSGTLKVTSLVILVPCSSTSHNRGTSHIHNKHKRRYTVAVALDLAFVEVVEVSYVHIHNHLMVIISAYHVQITLVIESLVMVLVQTCSLTTRMEDSQ